MRTRSWIINERWEEAVIGSFFAPEESPTDDVPPCQCFQRRRRRGRKRMKKEEGSRVAEVEYNEVEWERTVRRVLQHPALRVRPRRSCRWNKMRLFGIYGESAFPARLRGWGFLLRLTCWNRADPAGLRAAVFHGEARLQKFFSSGCCGLLARGAHRFLRCAGGRGHGFSGGKEIFPLLRPVSGHEPCLRAAEELPTEPGHLYGSQHARVRPGSFQPGGDQKVQNGAVVPKPSVSAAHRCHRLQRGAGLLLCGFSASVLHQSGCFSCV